MTKEEFERFVDLNKKFVESCERVAKYFVKLNSDYAFIDSWEYDEGVVYGEGSERLNYGYDDKFVDFDLEWLYATDDELQKYVDSELNRILREKEDMEKNMIELNESKERELYERLKKKFELGEE